MSLLWRADVEVVILGVLAAVAGVQVVLRRLAFFTMAMTHATFPGVVLATIAGFSVYLGGAVTGLVVCLAILLASRRRGQDSTTVTGVVLAAGFALGVALESTQPGFSTKLSELLVGSILTVRTPDLVVSGLVTIAVGALFALLRNPLLYLAFDPDGAQAAGYPVPALRLVVLVGVEAAVITSVPAVGVMLSVCLLVAPAAAARLWTDRIALMHVIAVVLAVGSGLAGLELSRRFDVAAGGAITLVATVAFILSWVFGPRRAVTWRSSRTRDSPYTRQQPHAIIRRMS